MNPNKFDPDLYSGVDRVIDDMIESLIDNVWVENEAEAKDKIRDLLKKVDNYRWADVVVKMVQAHNVEDEVDIPRLQELAGIPTK